MLERPVFGIAHMNMRDGRARLRRIDGLLGDLLRRNRHRRIVLDRCAAGDRAGQDGRHCLSPRPARLRSRGRQRRVDARHHLRRHQFHRALGQGRIDPVHAGIDQFAERAGLVVKRQQFIDDLVDRTERDQPVEHEILGNLGVRLLLVFLEDVHALGVGELPHHVEIVKTIRALGILARIASGGLVVVGHEHRARHAPMRRIGLGADRCGALRISVPVGLHPARQQKIRRQRMHAFLAKICRARRMRCDDRADDFGVGFLKRLRHFAEAEVRACPFLRSKS